MIRYKQDNHRIEAEQGLLGDLENHIDSCGCFDKLSEPLSRMRDDALSRHVIGERPVNQCSCSQTENIIAIDYVSQGKAGILLRYHTMITELHEADLTVQTLSMFVKNIMLVFGVRSPR